MQNLAEIKLEERGCACGCGETFKVMAKSTQKYSSLRCKAKGGNELNPIPKRSGYYISDSDQAELSKLRQIFNHKEGI